MKHTLLLLAILVMAGCEPYTHRPVITDKEPYEKGQCTFWYKGLGHLAEIAFVDSCNKYNIGDTIK